MDSRQPQRKWIVPLVLFPLGALLAYWLVGNEIRSVQQHLVGFPDADPAAQWLRPWLLGLACFLPGVAGLIYALSGIQDRYVYRLFVTSFGICAGGLGVIWLITDLSDNLNDIVRSSEPAATLFIFYGVQFPTVAVFLLPYVLLLSVLYCLGKMSASREIISMIQTGRSVTRVVRPLILAGAMATAFCIIFNYHWAPSGEGQQKIILDSALGRAPNQAENVLYYNETARRLWKIGAFPADPMLVAPLRNVVVTRMDKNGDLIARLLIPKASWNRESQIWTFDGVQVVSFIKGEPPVITRLTEPMVISDWSETPWQLIKPGLAAPNLGIPDLHSWLLSNSEQDWVNRRPYLTQWHYRWAQPFVCVITVLLAAPLGIVFSRRGASGGIAVAIFLCAAMLLFSRVALAIGNAGYVQPMVAAWATNIAFGILALVLMQRRISGRPIYQTLKQLLPSADN
jgi:lipopolysaccharide export system permease protein